MAVSSDAVDAPTDPIDGIDVDDVDARRPTIKFKWKPHGKQRAFLEAGDDHRWRVAAWGRRTGKSEVAGIECFRYAVENPGSNIWWDGPTYDQANDYGFNKLFPKIPKALLDGDPKRSKPREIYFKNGSVISYRSADRPDSLDGAGVDFLVVDEAAQTPELVWYQHLRPTLSDTQGEAVFISTPRGKNWFHDWHARGQSDDHPDVWSSQAASYENPYVPDTEIDDAASEIPDRVFKQEYLAIFVDESGGVFPGFKDRNVVDYDWRARNGNGPYTTGVDFARHQNWTVIITLDRDGLLVNYDRLQEESWPRIQQKVEQAYENYPGVVRVDATRDNKIVTDLEDAGVPIDAVNFRSQKKDIIENLATRLENGEIQLPDIPQLVNEMELYDYDVSRTGNVRYHGPEGWHDDTVDALALAAFEGPGPRSATWGPGRDVEVS
ncbi:MAG: terminase family protein [Halobacteria archaeon]|nr:terminase family protein [Halobacteria archaeon]